MTPSGSRPRNFAPRKHPFGSGTGEVQTATRSGRVPIAAWGSTRTTTSSISRECITSPAAAAKSASPTIVSITSKPAPRSAPPRLGAIEGFRPVDRRVGTVQRRRRDEQREVGPLGARPQGVDHDRRLRLASHDHQYVALVGHVLHLRAPIRHRLAPAFTLDVNAQPRPPESCLKKNTVGNQRSGAGGVCGAGQAGSRAGELSPGRVRAAGWPRKGRGPASWRPGKGRGAEGGGILAGGSRDRGRIRVGLRTGHEDAGTSPFLPCRTTVTDALAELTTP